MSIFEVKFLLKNIVIISIFYVELKEGYNLIE